MEKMYKNTSGMDGTIFGALLIAIVIRPERINGSSAHGLSIFKIRCFLAEYIHVPCLVNVKPGGHEGPEGMIHPNPGNTIAICNKVSVPFSNNGGIGAVNADAAIVF